MAFLWAFLFIGGIVALELLSRWVISVPSNKAVCIRYGVYIILGMIIFALGTWVIEPTRIDRYDYDYTTPISFTVAGIVYMVFGVATYLHNIYMRLCDIADNTESFIVRFNAKEKETASHTCSNCNTAWVGSSSVCPSCGAKEVKSVFSTYTNPTVPTFETTICPLCGQITRKNGKFCQKCGKNMTESVSAKLEEDDNWTPPIPEYEDQ